MDKLRAQKFVGLLYLEAVPLAAALMIAERFFKFGSFTLEALPFLATWFALSVLYTGALSILSRWSRLIPAPDRFRALSSRT